MSISLDGNQAPKIIIVLEFPGNISTFHPGRQIGTNYT